MAYTALGGKTPVIVLENPKPTPAPPGPDTTRRWRWWVFGRNWTSYYTGDVASVFTDEYEVERAKAILAAAGEEWIEHRLDVS